MNSTTKIIIIIIIQCNFSGLRILNDTLCEKKVPKGSSIVCIKSCQPSARPDHCGRKFRSNSLNEHSRGFHSSRIQYLFLFLFNYIESISHWYKIDEEKRRWNGVSIFSPPPPFGRFFFVYIIYSHLIIHSVCVRPKTNTQQVFYIKGNIIV